MFNMAGNTLGKLFTVTSFGESHGKAIGCIIDGCPAGFEISEECIQTELNKRIPGTNKYVSQRKETDKIKILSGVFEEKFPTIAAYLVAKNIDINQDLIPVKPAAHYFCGGVVSNKFGETSVNGLLAAGECAYTGLHGANRLASNSLLEAVVFAKNAADALNKNFLESDIQGVEIIPFNHQLCKTNYEILKGCIQSVMTREVGIVRSRQGLIAARKKLKRISASIQKEDYSNKAYELHNMIAVALLVVEDSLLQVANKGGFYRNDLDGRA